jgi:o-succinylbenzoate synthase
MPSFSDPASVPTTQWSGKEEMSLQDYSIGRIEHIHLHVVKLPLVGSFETSFAVQHDKEALLIQIESEGTTAWGECVADPDPFYAYETIPAARHIIKDFLLPLVQDGVTLGEVDRRFRHVRGHEMAKATVENALIDLVAKKQGVPLCALLGGEKKKIRSGISLGIKDNPDHLVETVEEAVQKKYHRVKMKIKKGKDSAYVRPVRGRFSLPSPHGRCECGLPAH